MATKKNEKQVWNYTPNEEDPLGKLVEKKGKKIVYTQPEMAKYLIDRTTFSDGELVCDCCRGAGDGGGVFYNQLPSHVVKSWYEINEGKDYLGDEKMMVNNNRKSTLRPQRIMLEVLPAGYGNNNR